MSLTVNNLGDGTLTLLPSPGPDLLGHGVFDVLNQANTSVLGTTISISALGNIELTATFDYGGSRVGTNALHLQLLTNDPTDPNAQVLLIGTVLKSTH
jgi:hypothetical protein